jgi:hypothetical protein
MTTQVKLRDSAITWREVDGETIVLDLATSRYVGVNRTGSVLWTQLARGTTADDLADALVDEFEVAPELARDDVATFLGACRKHGWLEE